jgi:general secretion pathway protein B
MPNAPGRDIAARFAQRKLAAAAAPANAPINVATKPAPGVVKPAPAETASTPVANLPAQATMPASATMKIPAATSASNPAVAGTNATSTKSPAPAAAPAAPKTEAAHLPLYYELPYETRKDLPTLVLSMHVYAADPVQRFIVVDGDRKAEGEMLKDGLALREIRPDGVVLEFRGQRFFYPRPGR